jgi:hypothetical protein
LLACKHFPHRKVINSVSMGAEVLCFGGEGITKCV